MANARASVVLLSRLVICGALAGLGSAVCHDAATVQPDLAGHDLTGVGSTDLARSDGSGNLVDLRTDVDLAGADFAGVDFAGVDLMPPAPLDPVAPLTIVRDKNESNFIGDEYGWIDALDLPRSALFTHNDRKDPQNHWGGLMRRLTYRFGNTARACVGTDNVGHPGFGKIISHYASTSTGSNTQGTFSRVLAGRHHAIHQYQWNISFGSLVVVATVHWFIANGRSHPTYAVTYDASGIAANALDADTRSPYGDLRWDYGSDADVTGVGWGDHYKFTSLGDPVCKKPSGGGCDCSQGGEGNGPCWTWDGWDYSVPNTVPYAFEWSSAADAEMGLVQTQTYAQHEGGGYWFYSNWGMTDTDGPMPDDYNWAYQLNQYSLPYNDGIKSKRLAWGMNFGAVGQNSFNAIGDAVTLDGYPYQSYTTFVVLNAHSLAPVAAQVSEVEAVQQATLTATKGTVRTKGIAGVGRSDEITYQPAGWNPIYGTWELDASSDAAALTFTAGVPLVNPVLVVHGYGATTVSVSIDGVPLEADKGFFASIDDANNVLWVTLRRTLSGAHQISIQP